MILKTLKLLFVATVAFAAYKGAEVYAGLKMVNHTDACLSELKFCEVAELRANHAQLDKVISETSSCVKARQSPLEAWFFPSISLFSTSISPDQYQPFVDNCNSSS